MSKHTPGPWELHEYKGGVEIRMGTRLQKPTHIYNNEHEIDWNHDLYNDGTDDIQYREAMANARLIAAAPDLLAIAEELNECAAYWSEYDVPLGIHDRLRAAIAKAKGEEQ